MTYIPIEPSWPPYYRTGCGGKKKVWNIWNIANGWLWGIWYHIKLGHLLEELVVRKQCQHRSHGSSCMWIGACKAGGAVAELADTTYPDWGHTESAGLHSIHQQRYSHATCNITLRLLSGDRRRLSKATRWAVLTSKGSGGGCRCHPRSHWPSTS